METPQVTLSEIASQLGAKILTPQGDLTRRVERVYAGDRMSDLLSHAGVTTLVVTNLSTPQLIRAVALMDSAGVCLVGGATPDSSLLAAAAASSTVVMVSPYSMFETCGRLYQCMSRAHQASSA